MAQSDLKLVPKLIDIVNLFISRGANFILMLALFGALRSTGDISLVAQFGFYWGLSLALGGLLFSGTFAAMIRVLAVRNSLRLLAKYIPYIGGAAVAIFALSGVLYLAMPTWQAGLYLIGLICGTGILLQTYLGIVVILRVLENTKWNFIVALGSVLIMAPIMYYSVSGATTINSAFERIFCVLLVANILFYILTYRVIGPAITQPDQDTPLAQSFMHIVLSFACLNIWGYCFLLVDYTALNWAWSVENFEQVSLIKIYFERFVIPLLYTVSGAVTIRILRHGSDGEDTIKKATLRLTPQIGAILGIFVVGLSLIFWVVYRPLFPSISTQSSWVIPVLAMAYLLYVLNAVLLDLTVVRKNLRYTAACVAGLLLMTCTLIITISLFESITLWAVGFLTANAVSSYILIKINCTIELHRKQTT